MYALLLPSAHNFISAVEENVNVEVRAIGVPTPTPTPCLFPSPACTALVCAPRKRLLVREVVEKFLARREIVVFIVLPFWSRVRPRQAPIWAGSNSLANVWRMPSTPGRAAHLGVLFRKMRGCRANVCKAIERK